MPRRLGGRAYEKRWLPSPSLLWDGHSNASSPDHLRRLEAPPFSEQIHKQVSHFWVKVRTDLSACPSKPACHVEGGSNAGLISFVARCAPVSALVARSGHGSHLAFDNQLDCMLHRGAPERVVTR